MTLSSTTSKATYNGDGSTTAFSVSFIFWDNGDLRVIHRDANAAETVWTEGTQYTLTGGSGATGTLTVKTTPTDYTPASGETLTIKDNQSEVQGDSLPLSGAFPSTVVEQRFDKITRLIQNHSEEIARSILLPETASLSGLQLPEPGAGEIVRYNAGGTDLETVAIGDISTAIDTLLTGLATNDFLYWDNAQSAWVNITPGATGLAIFQDATAAAVRAELGLGTAALVDTGVGDGNAIVADATGLPVIDGSQVTNLSVFPRGHIDGLILSNDGTDPAKDIGISAGEATDDGQAVTMVLSSALIKKLDTAWAVGTNVGALDGTESVAGTPDADTWYHIWLIRRSDTGVVDVLASESATAPTMPTNYDQKRRIGAALFDSTPDIITFFQDGDYFYWDVPVQDYDDTNPGTSAVTRTLTVPTGLIIKALHHFKGITTSVGNAFFGLATSLDQTDSVPSATKNHIDCPSGNYLDGASLRIRTDTSGQIRTRISNTASVNTIYGTTEGWIDPRGRNA